MWGCIPTGRSNFAFTVLKMEGFRRLVDLVRFRGEIAYSMACEQHFDQESAERADGEKQGEPKGYEQRNTGLISKSANEQKEGRD